MMQVDALEIVFAGVTFLVIASVLVGIVLQVLSNAPVRIGSNRVRTGKTGPQAATPVTAGPGVAGRW